MDVAVAMQVVALLQEEEVELDDEMVRFVRANLAQAREPAPVAPPSDGDRIDTGGPEPMNQGGSVRGGVRVGNDHEQTLRERVMG